MRWCSYVSWYFSVFLFSDCILRLEGVRPELIRDLKTLV
jgi:hypothetical protein